MIAALKHVAAGRKVEDVARDFGVSKHTVYAWNAKYGGMEVTEAHEAGHAGAVSSCRYQTRRSDEDLRERLGELAREKRRFRYRRLHALLRWSVEAVNHKRVHRVYREAGLTLRRKKRKHCVRRAHRFVSTRPPTNNGLSTLLMMPSQLAERSGC